MLYEHFSFGGWGFASLEFCDAPHELRYVKVTGYKKVPEKWELGALTVPEKKKMTAAGTETGEGVQPALHLAVFPSLT